MKRFFVKAIAAMLLVLCASSQSWAQQSQLKKLMHETRWTDGNTFYYAEVKGDFVNFSGGTMHEGGYAFGLRSADGGGQLFTLEGGFWSEESTEPQISFNGIEGQKVERRELNGETYLLIKDLAGATYYAFKQVADFGLGLLEEISKPMIHAYEGTYVVAQSSMQGVKKGDRCTFSGNHVKLGSVVNCDYKLGQEFESPSNILCLENGTCFRVNFSKNPNDLQNGLKLYETKYSEEYDLYGEEELKLLLYREPDQQCRWPETSERVMLNGELSNYPRPMLRLIRNEIFARHGYIFNSKDLQQYFGAQDWYQPAPDASYNKKFKPSFIESINIGILKNLEDATFYWLPEFD